jgi:long-chain acyl-CoA synthetase
MGKLKLYDIPYFDTFFQYVTHLSKYGDKVGICQYDRKGDLTTHTYGELAADALGLARVLRARGLEGAHIAIAGENSYEWLSALLGITSAGAVAVPIDIEQSDDTIRAMLRRADAVSAFASDTLLPICAPLQEDGTLQKLLPLKGTGGETLRTLCEEGKNMDTPLGDNLAADTDAAIFFTSGTTSAAKPVLLSHQNMLVSATESVRLALATQEAFVPLPLYHAFGLDNAVLGNMINGVKLTLCGDLKTMLRDMQLSGAATLVAVPLMVEAIYRGLMKGVEDAGMGDAVRKLMSINRFPRRFRAVVQKGQTAGDKREGRSGQSQRICHRWRPCGQGAFGQSEAFGHHAFAGLRHYRVLAAHILQQPHILPDGLRGTSGAQRKN